MSNLWKYIMIAFVLQFAIVGHGDETKQDKRSRDSYSMIFQRNIFSKNRSPRRTERVDPRPVDPNSLKKPDITFVYVLRGVAIDKNSKTAFLENQSSGEFFQVSAGEEIDGMVIKEIKDDRVEFEKGGDKVDIFVGMDLSGVRTGAGSAVPGASGSSGSDTGSGEGSSPSSADEAEMLRIMMERRKQQLGN